VASEVQVWGLQRVSVREVVPHPRGGTEAVALLRLEHAVCSRALPMDDGSNIGAGQLALPSTYQWQTRWASEDNVHRASADTTTSKRVLWVGRKAHSYFVLISIWWRGGRGVDVGLIQSTKASWPQHVEIAWHGWQGGATRCSWRWSRLLPRRAPPRMPPAGTKPCGPSPNHDPPRPTRQRSTGYTLTADCTSLTHKLNLTSLPLTPAARAAQLSPLVIS
jgi:hypothetical protein